MVESRIPGQHTRRCPACGVKAVLTPDASRLVSAGRLVERRSSPCPSCGRAIDYAVPTGSDEPTRGDVTTMGEVLRRLRGTPRIPRPVPSDDPET